MPRRDKDQQRARRKRSIRGVVSGSPERPRLTVFRSNQHIYAQVIDDTSSRSLAAASTKTKDLAEALKGAESKVDCAKIVGKAVAEICKARGIERVVFDRNGYLYHGRVRALADAAREAGLDF